MWEIGWNCLEEVEDLKPLLHEIGTVKYEIEHCNRGSLTTCRTTGELGRYLHQLANRLNNIADRVEEIKDIDGMFQ